MGKDAVLKRYYSDNTRYADLINGLCFCGEQVVHGEDLVELDSQVVESAGVPFLRENYSANKRADRGGRHGKYRDLIRKAALGVSFVVVGIENQEKIDHSIPLRNLSYETGEYERQAAAIRRRVRKDPQGLSDGEYMYGFRKDSRLNPCVTFILYYGTEDWDGPTDLYGMLDFRDIPPQMKSFISNYKINLVEIRKLQDTSVFKTDIRQVFDFIRCSKDPKALQELVENDSAYREMEEDAFDVAAQYTNSEELIQAKEYQRGGKIDMCYAITELINEGRNAGYSEGRNAGYNAGRDAGYSEGRSTGYNEGEERGIRVLVKTCRDFRIPRDQAFEKVKMEYALSDEETRKYMEGYGE